LRDHHLGAIRQQRAGLQHNTAFENLRVVVVLPTAIDLYARSTRGSHLPHRSERGSIPSEAIVKRDHAKEGAQGQRAAGPQRHKRRDPVLKHPEQQDKNKREDG
jgi:hypothetical protein